MQNFIPLLVCLFGLIPLSSQAQTFSQLPPAPTKTWVNDQANILSEPDKEAAEKICASLFAQNQVPLFVLTLPSLAVYDASTQTIGPFTKAVFNTWGVGNTQTNKGILLLVAPNDRSAHIQIGDGWNPETKLQTDGIMHNILVPLFQKNLPSKATLDSTQALANMALGITPKVETPKWFWPAIILGGIALAAILFSLFSQGKSGWAWALIGVIITILFFLLRHSSSASDGLKGGSSSSEGSTGKW